MTEYRVRRTSNNDYLAHAGKKGSRWGYTNSKRNGNRTAEGEKPVYGPNGAPYGPNRAPVSYGPRNQRVVTRRTESLKNQYDTEYDKDGPKYTYVYKGKADQFKDKVEKATSNLGQKVRDAVIGKEGKVRVEHPSNLGKTSFRVVSKDSAVGKEWAKSKKINVDTYGPQNNTQYKTSPTTQKSTVDQVQANAKKTAKKIKGASEKAVDRGVDYVSNLWKKLRSN